ncbi:AgrD family cyclic lactone autoinducer peptide [Brevibacillus formosus]
MNKVMTKLTKAATSGFAGFLSIVAMTTVNLASPWLTNSPKVPDELLKK